MKHIAKQIKSLSDRLQLCELEDGGAMVRRCDNIFRNSYSRKYGSESDALAALWSDEVEWLDGVRVR